MENPITFSGDINPNDFPTDAKCLVCYNATFTESPVFPEGLEELFLNGISNLTHLSELPQSLKFFYVSLGVII